MTVPSASLRPSVCRSKLVVATGELLAATTRIELDEEAPSLRETYPVGGRRHVPIRIH